MAAQISNLQIGTMDSVAAGGYAYPTSAYVAVVTGRNGDGTSGEFHIIWNAGAPGSSFNNAPVGSIYVDTTTTTGKLYHKNASGANWTPTT